MGRGIGDLIAALVVGAIGYGIASNVVKITTGKHIHEHLFDWYRRAHDAVARWARAQGLSRTVRILATVDTVVTGLFRRAASLRFFGDRGRFRKPELIIEETVSFAELAKQFDGQLGAGQTYDVTQMILN